MSQNPWGQPPPYPHMSGYQPPPPNPGYQPTPGAFTYVPAPVMMPVYPPPPQGPPATYPMPQPIQPTPVHVTPQPVGQPTPIHTTPHQVQELIDWVPATGATASSLSHRALVVGKEAWDQSPLWVIRAHHSGEFVPGKLAIKHRSAYVPHSGREIPVHNFEVLCAPEHIVRWVPASNGEVPPGAIIAGNSHTAEPLYVCRVRHLKSITPGKVHPSHGCAYISFGGSEIKYKQYDVLCKIQTVPNPVPMSAWR